MSKYLFNQIDVNQIKCVFLALIPNYFSKLKIRPPKAINHGLRYRLSATTAPQDLPTGFIFPPEHFVSNHQRYKSWCNSECLDLFNDHDSHLDNISIADHSAIPEASCKVQIYLQTDANL